MYRSSVKIVHLRFCPFNTLHLYLIMYNWLLMKKLFFLSLIFLAQLSNGQLIIKPIKPDLDHARTNRFNEELTPISLPFWDDFAHWYISLPLT